MWMAPRPATAAFLGVHSCILVTAFFCSSGRYVLPFVIVIVVDDKKTETETLLLLQLRYSCYCYKYK